VTSGLPVLLAALAIPQLPTAPEACPELARRLRAPRRSQVAEFRALLDLVGAEYPNDVGQFIPKPPPPPPPRKKGEPRPPPPPELDWLPALAGAAVPPELETARAEAVDLVATLRALASTRRWDKECPVARVLLDFAFEDHAGAFRDEVGRQVRALGEAALPPLIRLALGQGKVARGERRYGNYQLDRMDRQRPETVMAQVRDDRIRAEILTAYGETRPASAVHVVLGECDASSPRVRRAARWAWMQYVTQKPPDPPKRKLKLTGGKETDEEKELYLSYRELADLEIRRQWPALMNEPADPEKPLAELSAALFAKQDGERAQRWDAQFAQAETRRQAGDLAGAVGIYGWILAQDPFYGRRSEMAPGYLALARTLMAERRFAEAAGWLRQARALAPAGSGRDVEAALALCEGLLQLESGGTDVAALERALALDRGQVQAQTALRQIKLRRFGRTLRRAAPVAGALSVLVLGCLFLWWRAARAAGAPRTPPARA